VTITGASSPSWRDVGSSWTPDIPLFSFRLHLGAKPKRGPERICPTDIPRVDFIAVVEKIIEQIEHSE
jgi:hypothetical protein